MTKTLTRTKLLKTDLIRLSILGKFYNISAMGNPKMHINWVDSLIEFLPDDLAIFDWGVTPTGDSKVLLGGKTEYLLLMLAEHRPEDIDLCIMSLLRNNYHLNFTKMFDANQMIVINQLLKKMQLHDGLRLLLRL